MATSLYAAFFSIAAVNFSLCGTLNWVRSRSVPSFVFIPWFFNQYLSQNSSHHQEVLWFAPYRSSNNEHPQTMQGRLNITRTLNWFDSKPVWVEEPGWKMTRLLVIAFSLRDYQTEFIRMISRINSGWQVTECHIKLSKRTRKSFSYTYKDVH